MDYYKPLENLNQADTVLIKSIGEAEQGKYGKQHQCSVTVNGDLMTWTMSEDKMRQFQEAGFKSGDTVLIQKWKEGVKKGYNFKSPESNPYEQPKTVDFVQTEPVKQVDSVTTSTGGEPQVYKAPTDPVQERILKGMCFNGACRLFSQTGNGNGDTIKTEVILNTSKALYKEMKEWLTT